MVKKENSSFLYRLLAVMAFVVSVVSAFAAETHDVITIEFKDGTRVEYELQSKPKVYFAPPVMVVTTENASVEYEIKNVSNFHFSVAATNVREVLEEHRVRMSYVSNDFVNILGALACNVSLFDVGGHLLRKQEIDKNNYTVSLVGLPQGVYLLKLSNGCSLKISKK